VGLNKEWYQIVAPPIFGNKTVGETPAFDPKNIIGRTYDVSLVELTDDLSKFYLKVKLKVYKIDGTKAYTQFVGHEMMRERVYRLVQRRSERVDVIKDVKLKDGSEIRLKFLIILIRNTSNSINTAVRKKTEEFIEEYAKNSDLNGIINGILSGEISKKLKEILRKIYPVGAVELRKSEVKKQPTKEIKAEKAEAKN